MDMRGSMKSQNSMKLCVGLCNYVCIHVFDKRCNSFHQGLRVGL